MEEVNLLETLSKELSSLISGAEEDMIQFETSFTSELLNSLFRKIHTIKGNSGMANLKKIERLSHSLEHILSKMRSNELAPSEEINQLIFDSIDRLKQMIFNLENESTVVVQDLVERLNLLEENKEKNSINIEPLTPYRELAISQECFLWNAEIYFPVNLFPTLASVISTLNQISQATLVKTPNWEKMQDSKTKGNLSFIWKVLFITEQEPQNYIATHSLIANNITLHYQPHKQEITQNLKSATSKESKDLRITSQNMEEMIELAKEIIITRNILAKKLNIREDTEEEFLFIKHTNLILQLHDKLIRNRLQKFHAILPRLQRMVRDISKSLKKEIDFEFKGGEVELDGMFMESLNECLLHMIRNAIDHGIEETQERILLGKNPKGTIRLTASLRSGNVQIEVEDDGRGIDLSKIKSRAVEKGLFDWQTLGQMSDSEVMEIIFRPGFSTSEKITDLSGRGVGMDVVLTNFRKFGGNIKIETFPGKGTKFIGSVPQIISSMPCAILRVLEERFVILKKKILEFGFFKKENLEIFENKKVYKIREKLYPFLDLQEVFFPDVKEETPSGYILLANTEQNPLVLKFDEIISFEDLVIKPLPNEIKDIKLFSGITIAGDGKILLLLELEEIMKNYKIEVLDDKKQVKKQKSTQAKDYIIFEFSKNKFLLDAEKIIRIAQVTKNNITFVLEKPMIKLGTELYPIFSIQDYFHLQETQNLEKFYVAIVSFQDKKYCIILDDIIDVLNEPEFFQNRELNQDISKYVLYEGEVVLYLDLDRIFLNKGYS